MTHSPSNNRGYYNQLLPSLALLLLAAIPLLFLPFGRDQASLAYVGRGLLDGGLPYVEYWDHKGPLLPWIYALVSWGDIDYYKLHLLDFAALLACCVMLAQTLRKVTPRPPVAVTVIALGAMYLTVSFWHLAQAEIFIAVLLVGAMLLVIDRENSRPIAAALLLGIAATIKPVSLFHLAALALIVIRDSRGRRRTGRLLAMLGAFSLGPLVFVLIYLAAGHFTELVECYLWFNLLQAKGSLLLLAVGAVVHAVYVFLFPLTFSAIGIFELRRIADNRERLVLSSFTWASLIAVFAQQRLWLYHWVIAMPFIAVYVGYGLQFCGRLARENNKSYLQRLVLALLIIAAAGVYGERWVDTSGLRALIPAKNEMEYYGAFVNEGESYDLVRSYEIAAYVKHHTQPRDKILLWGFDGSSYRLADRPHATRFLMDLPLTFTPQSKKALELQTKWRHEFIEQLENDSPVLIGIGQDDTNAIEENSSAESAELFIAFNVLLRTRYEKAELVGNTQFYRLRHR